MNKRETPVVPQSAVPTKQITGIVGIAVVLIVILFGAVKACQPFEESGGGNKYTEPPPGDDPTHFDPIATMQEVQAYAGEGAQLVSLTTSYVSSDGTLNLKAEGYYPTARYTFVREVPPPTDAPPIGAGGSTTGLYYQRIEVNVYRPDVWYSVTSGSNSYTYLHKGMERDEDDPTGNALDTIPLPTCSFATLWEQALTDGAPGNAVAFIDYDEDGYSFSIHDVDYGAQFNRNCQKIGG